MKRFLLLIVPTLFLLAACDQAADPKNVVGYDNTVQGNMFVDYGNGVFYFPYTEADFGNKLAQFRKQHSEWHIVAVTGNGTGYNGVDQGYWVICDAVQK